MQINFLGGSDEGRSTNVNAARSINLYPEINVVGSKGTISLVGTPGTKTINTFPAGPHRMAHVVGGRCFVVAGNVLYEFYSNDAYSVPLGVFPSSTGFIPCADNGVGALGTGGNQLLMISDGNGYIYNLLENTFVQITDAGFPSGVTDCAYIDGYFVVINDTMTYHVSALYGDGGGLVWPGLAFAQVMSTPDKIQKVVNLYNQLFFIKEYSTEIWYNTGTSTTVGSPFARVSGGMKDFGTPAPFSVARSNNVAFFLANTRNDDVGNFTGVAMLSGYDITMVSTPAINYKLSQFTTLSDAWGYCYSNEGHMFYVLTFPAEDATFVYDISTQMWHERSTNTDVDGNFVTHRHLANTHTYFNNRHIVGHCNDGRLMELSTKYYSDDDVPIVGIRVAQPVFDKNELENVSITKLIIDMETGVGDDYMEPTSMATHLADGSYSADGSIMAGAVNMVLTGSGDPQAYLSWSNDGGHTWSNEYRAGIGKAGEYRKRLIWRRLGAPRNRVFRLRLPDAIKKVLIGAYVNNGALPS